MTQAAKDTMEQMELIAGAIEVESKPKKARNKAKEIAAEHLPPNLAQPIKVKVPDFSDPNRPKTCLEVDFPIVPINALSALEGNAGKPIYQMSKWWARRRSCVFRAMLIAAAMEAPSRKNADGSVVLDENGIPEPDLDEAHKAVWDVYYANHQKAENFKHLKVLDCFMGGGTTLVEGSRLGFQMSGVDLNPIAWFVVKNELACTDPNEVERFFDQIEAEVKPQIQPFYVTDCPRGHKGKWFDVESGEQVDVDPALLPPDHRKKYRYEGPELVYTFWAKHGPCVRPDCDNRTPIFRSPVIAEKRLGVKYMELTCKRCKTAFHAELGSARMAPTAERVILDNEHPFTELSQPFAERLLNYAKGNGKTRVARVHELLEIMNDEPGLMCPDCGTFAGQWLRNVLDMHKSAQRVADIDKKHLKIIPARNSKKPVYAYLLIHPDWLRGASGHANGRELGGYIDAPVADTAAWYDERLRTLRLIEVRGRIKLSEDNSHLGMTDDDAESETDYEEHGVSFETSNDTEDHKDYGLPRFITLSDNQRIDTQHGTVPSQSAFTCQECGHSSDFLDALKAANPSYSRMGMAREATECPSCVATDLEYRTAPVAPYAIQGYCPHCHQSNDPSNGTFFSSINRIDVARLIHAEQEWDSKRSGALANYWPTATIPHALETHIRKPLACWGYTHFRKMFLPRQLLVLASLAKSIATLPKSSDGVQWQAAGALQQYLRNMNQFCIWNAQACKLEPFFSNPNYHPKQTFVENGFLAPRGRGNWGSSRRSVVEGLQWAIDPFERIVGAKGRGSSVVAIGDPVSSEGHSIHCRSSTELADAFSPETIDLVITDPPFGYNLAYADMADFSNVWLRQVLSGEEESPFDAEITPKSQEVITNVAEHPDDRARDARNSESLHPADQFYQDALTACWRQVYRLMKDAGVLAFTFHHAADEPWIQVLESLFEAGLYLEATYPVLGDETKGEGSKPGTFGAQKIEYDIIHVCRKRLDEPKPVSWPKMRQWVKAELKRLRPLLESYKTRELPDADIRVILRGKALEFYSRHYGKVYTAEDAELSIRDALLGINQLLDEDTGEPGERPPSILQPTCYQFLRLFGDKASLKRDEVGKNLRGTGMLQREFTDRGWVEEKSKIVYRVPIKEQFEKMRQRPRKEMKTEIDQAHFLIGAALPGSGVNIKDELSKNTWVVRRSVEAVLQWYAKTAVEPQIKDAAELAAILLRKALETRRAELVDEQGFLFDDLEEVM